MFDLNDKSSTRVIRDDPEARMQFDEYGEDEGYDGHPLDAPDMQELHTRLMGFYRRELDRQYDNRMQMAKDADYYDNEQWSPEEVAELESRGQAAIVYNVISQTVNWVIGSEKRGRSDFNVLPRTKEDAKPAERKTQLLKYMSDVNMTPFHRSRAFEDAAKVGMGWLEDGVSDRDDNEPVFSRYESWRNMLWDSACNELDLSDARYVIRSKWVDLDVACAMFPERDQIIKESASAGYLFTGSGEDGDEAMDAAEVEYTFNGGAAGNHSERDRVRMVEIWYKTPARVQRLVGGQFAGEIHDPDSLGHQVSLASGASVVAERMMMRTSMAVMVAKGLCWNGPSPYRHNRYPFTPIWGYRRDRDGMPYGIIRNLRDLQDDINKRASKAQFILASNKVIMEKGAVDNMQELLDEVSRPDGVIVVNQNKRFEINADRELAPAHLDLMAREISMIQSVSGVTDELMGRSTNAKSGVAIQARQEQGSMSTSKLFDNLRYAFQIQGEKQLSLLEQYYSEQKQFRITNSRGTPTYIDINDGLPENDITRSKADFILSDAEWRASLRQAQTEQLMEMLGRMPPQVALVMLDLLVESMDLPNRDELVRRIRQINGQRDPDATEMTPEEQQAQAAQQAQAQMQQAMAEAQLRKVAADAAKGEAAAQEMAARIANLNVATQLEAVQAAQVAMQTPGLLSVADGILQEGGYMSPTDQAKAGAAQAQMEQNEQQRMAEQQAAAQAQQEQEQQAQQQAGQQAAQDLTGAMQDQQQMPQPGPDAAAMAQGIGQ